MSVKESSEYSIGNIIRAIGDDDMRDGLKDTPARVVRSWKELFSGYHEDPLMHLKALFPNEGSTDLICVNDIDFFSTCEHHMLPFHGTVDVAYVPGDRVLGLSKFARLVNGYARRLQVQERLTKQIADALYKHELGSLGVAVRIRGQHMCMVARGAKNAGATMTTVAVKGCFYGEQRPDVVWRDRWERQLP